MGAAPGGAGNRTTGVATASAKPTLWASGHTASAVEVPGHQGTQVLRVTRSVPYKRPARVRANGRTCVVGQMPAHPVQHHGERVSELLHPLRVAEIAKAKGTECLAVVVRERYTHPKTNVTPEPDSVGSIFGACGSAPDAS
jgi:hypothetical protein